MIFVIYALISAAVIFCSIKCADYVDLLDKKSNLSGAFIGGVILAAVTSLPELFTSISATAMIGKPELVIGNILGSNIFNLSILSMLVVFMTRKFAKASVAKSHFKTALFVLLVYIVMIFTVVMGYDVTIPKIGVSLTTVIIIVLYIISVKSMGSDTAADSLEEISCTLTVKQIVVRFIIFAVMLIAASIYMTYVVDDLVEVTGIGATLGGAVFLGVATSLPELVSSITLAKKGNFNAMAGNIVGSNMFNFIIIAVADFIYNAGSVYTVGGESAQTNLLIVTNIIATAFIGALILVKNKKGSLDKKGLNAFYIITALAAAACYIVFLAGAQ